MNRFLVFSVLIATLFVAFAFAFAQNDKETGTQANVSAGTIETAQALSNPIESGKVSSEVVPADTIYPISPERRALLNKYSSFSFNWTLFNDIFQWILLLVIALSGVSANLLKLAERMAQKRSFQFLLYLLFISVATSIISLPFDIYRDFFVEHNYGFSNQTFGAWLGDWLKSFPIEYIVLAIAFGFSYYLIRKFPRRWWLWFSLGAIPFIVLMIIIVPIVIAPMFNDFKPLENQQLKTQLLDLADKAGIEGAHVFQVDASRQSNKLNAYVTGLFATKRIVLYDTIIKAFTNEELMFVMAHEMGHYVMYHIWFMVAMIIGLIFLSSWLTGKYLPGLIVKYQQRLGFAELKSYASLPLIMFAFSFIMFFAAPITNGMSRYFERQADKYGMEMTNYDSDAAVIAFEKLSAYNLSDPNPGPLKEFWFYDHPALQKRIDFIKKYKGK
jgi:STE24 endopeptidase